MILKADRKKILLGSLVALVMGVLLAPPSSAHAFKIEDTNVETQGDFVLEPAKLEISLRPGESTAREISVTNRMDQPAAFTVSTEDFKGSQDPQTPVILLGDEKGPYSLKDFIKPEIRNFNLSPRQRITFSVTVSAPQDAEPGGLYGSLLISSSRSTNAAGEGRGAEGRAVTISRLGALAFVRVDGDVEEASALEDFRIAGPRKVIYTRAPEAYEVLVANNGNVHLLPQGSIEIKNMFGAVVEALPVPPFFVLPNSLRSAEIKAPGGFMLGRYTATAVIDRGYQDSESPVDQRTITFWVIPWLYITLALLVLVVLLIGFRLRNQRR